MPDQIERAFSGRRVLVTGGAGFVGGALVRRLVRAKARVTVMDDLFTGQPEVVPPSAELVQGSVEDELLVRVGRQLELPARLNQRRRDGIVSAPSTQRRHRAFVVALCESERIFRKRRVSNRRFRY